MNTDVSANSIDAHQFDVRLIPCRVKHAQILQRWENLAVGDHFILVNDHDPVPLYYQFSAQFPGAFSWEYLLRNDDEFRVRIRKLAATPTVAKPSLLDRKQVPMPPSLKGSTQSKLATRGPSVKTVDVRGLEPPEPMMRILNEVAHLAEKDSLKAITDRRPVHLFSELETRGFSFENEQRLDGTWLTQISRRQEDE